MTLASLLSVPSRKAREVNLGSAPQPTAAYTDEVDVVNAVCDEPIRVEEYIRRGALPAIKYKPDELQMMEYNKQVLALLEQDVTASK